MAILEQPYLDLLRDVMENGRIDPNRTDTPAKRVFGRQLRFDLTKGFPLITTKKVFMKGVIYENLWFLGCDGADPTNAKYLQDHKVKIWDEWAKEDGSLGPIYGYQWRHWPGKIEVYPCSDEDKAARRDHWQRIRPEDIIRQEDGLLHSSSFEMVDGIPVSKNGRYYRIGKPIDQIQKAIDTIKNSPYSRRIIVNAWNPTDLDDMALTPCHFEFQFNVRPFSLRERVQYFIDNSTNYTHDHNFEYITNSLGIVELDSHNVELAVDQANVPKGYLDMNMNIRKH